MNVRKSLARLCAAGVLAALVVPATVSAHDADHFVAGEPGNPKRPFRTVLVTMREGDGKMLYRSLDVGGEAG